jgi:phosphatidylglycerol:prolipoprotein diacylglycerol transferase
MTPRIQYAAFMLLALVVFVLARRLLPIPSPLAERPRWQRWLVGMAAFVGGIFGAKLPFALGAPPGPWSAGAWLADGKTIITGLAGAYIAVELAKLALGIHVKTGDSFALPLALAMAVGRCGCFFNGCCYGTPTDLPWAVDFGEGVRRHPTQIYESVFHLTMAMVLLLFMRRGIWRSHLLQFYLIIYCLYRMATELIRPEPVWSAGMTFYQVAAIGLATALGLQWLLEYRMATLRAPAQVTDTGNLIPGGVR